jgi:fructokinase
MRRQSRRPSLFGLEPSVRIVSIGEILWDVLPTGEHQIAEYLGGAPFNFAVHAHRLGHDVRFISAVGDDDRGRRALRQMEALGLSTEFVRTVANAATGVVTVNFESNGEPHYEIHRPAAYDFLDAPPACSADWIYFGTLLQTNPGARSAVTNLLRSTSARRFYDVNLRENSFTLELVRELLSEANVVKMNEAESRVVLPLLDTLNRDFDAICITRGKDGCSIWRGGAHVDSPGYPVSGGDPVGAGDAFAAAFLHGLDAGWPVSKIAEFANLMGAEAAGHAGAV